MKYQERDSQFYSKTEVFNRCATEIKVKFNEDFTNLFLLSLKLLIELHLENIFLIVSKITFLFRYYLKRNLFLSKLCYLFCGRVW